MARRIALSYLPACSASFPSFSVLRISPTFRPLSRARFHASMARVNRSIASALVTAGLSSGSGVFSTSTGSGTVWATIGIRGGGDSVGAGGSSAGGGLGRSASRGPTSAASMTVARYRCASRRLSSLAASSRRCAASRSVSSLKTDSSWARDPCSSADASCRACICSVIVRSSCSRVSNATSQSCWSLTSSSSRFTIARNFASASRIPCIFEADARTASTKNGGACSVDIAIPLTERDGIGSPHPVINDWAKKSAVTIKDRAQRAYRRHPAECSYKWGRSAMPDDLVIGSGRSVDGGTSSGRLAPTPRPGRQARDERTHGPENRQTPVSGPKRPRSRTFISLESVRGASMARNLYFLGTAGSGKSTMVYAFQLWMNSQGLDCVTVNLDPGAEALQYSPDLDVRDYVNLEEVMAEQGLGPNGAQVAAADMAAMNAKELADVLETFETNYVLIDTPGQIELFTFRASGPVLIDAFGRADSALVYLNDPALVKTASGFISSVLLNATVQFRHGLPLDRKSTRLNS